MSEAGCTDEEMTAVPGHKSATSPRIYTKGAKQTRLVESAITKIEQNRNKTSPTRSFKFEELPKRIISSDG
jgi:hypothetical protein